MIKDPVNAIMPLNLQERVKLRVSDFLLLNDAGAYASVRKTELIDGEVIGLNAQHRPHSYAKFRLARAIEDALMSIASNLGVLTEASIEMPPHDMPEPDIVVTSEPRGKGFIPLATVALVVEVADTTLGFDLRNKAKIYSSHSVPEYWVVDLNSGQIIRMWQPGTNGYVNSDAIAFGSQLASVTIPGLQVATDALT